MSKIKIRIKKSSKRETLSVTDYRPITKEWDTFDDNNSQIQCYLYNRNDIEFKNVSDAIKADTNNLKEQQFVESSAKVNIKKEKKTKNEPSKPKKD